MEALMEKIADHCVKNRIIPEERKPFLKYNLYKRVSSIIGLMLLFPLGWLLAGWQTSVAFLVGFYAFRRWINGYHASTWLRCTIFSVLLEAVFLAGLLPLLNEIAALAVTAASFAVILFAAPYNHPNMHYTKEELRALTKCIRIAVPVWSAITAGLYCFRLYTVVRGLATGFAMAAFLLIAAYLQDWRKKYADH